MPFFLCERVASLLKSNHIFSCFCFPTPKSKQSQMLPLQSLGSSGLLQSSAARKVKQLAMLFSAPVLKPGAYI